jgi:hypothetical protein
MSANGSRDLVWIDGQCGSPLPPHVYPPLISTIRRIGRLLTPGKRCPEET